MSSASPSLKMSSDSWQAEQLSPAVAFLLHSEHFDPKSVKGSGRAGRILKGDVLKAIKEGTIKKAAKSASSAAASSSSSAAAVSSISSRRVRDHTDLPLTQIRKVIASRLLSSKQSIPHSYASITSNMNAILALRQQWKESGRETVPSVNDLVIRASALALRRVPEVNTIYDPKSQSYHTSPTVDISVAVATPTGLITPIVTNADRKRLDAIGAEVKALAGKAKSGTLKPSEFQGGSFTISNLGMFGVDNFSAIINPPQVCILAVGGSVQRIDEAAYAEQKEKEKKAKDDAAAVTAATASKATPSPIPFAHSSAFASPAPAASTPAATPVLRLPTATYMTVTLVSDERAVDGEAASRFLTAFKQLIENPLSMQ